MTKISIVFRALNEAKWFGDALASCVRQETDADIMLELLLVDSGSTDGTLEIAKKYGCRIVHIGRSEFTFGRSLNFGCEAATGDLLVFISAHCIPIGNHWLHELVAPLRDKRCDYVYGRQIGLPGTTRFSEQQVFEHFFGDTTDLRQHGFFCNNANSAIRRQTWEKYRFDETVTGLEDMVLAKSIVSDGGQIGYVASASVTHIHEESLRQTYKRYFREALVMRTIMPEVHFNTADLIRCLAAGIWHDLRQSLRQRLFWREAPGIFGYRFMQYWATYRGHNDHRQLSRSQKENYYYPRLIRPSTAATERHPYSAVITTTETRR